MLKVLTYFCEDGTVVGRQVLFFIKIHTYIAYFIYFAFFDIPTRFPFPTRERIPYILVYNQAKWLINNLDRDYKPLPLMPNEE